MTIDPISGQTPFPAGPTQAHSRWATWSVWLAEAGAVLAAIAVALYGVAYAVGGSEAAEDNWLAWVIVATFIAALLTSVAGFVLAVVAKVRQERWALWWLPLSVLPALLAFVVLGEAFWWE